MFVLSFLIKTCGRGSDVVEVPLTMVYAHFDSQTGVYMGFLVYFYDLNGLKHVDYDCVVRPLRYLGLLLRR